MELQKIKQLIDVLAASDLAEMELVEGDHRVRLVRRVNERPAASAQPPRVPQPMTPATDAAPREAVATGTTAPDLVRSPLFGVLHLTPEPGAAVFVQAGDTVDAGQTLCVVEAMKMFHEVKAPRRGVVEVVLAQAGDEVQAGAVLFRMKAVELL